MAATMRLKRMGAKKRPYYRVVVTDSEAPRDGRFVEEVGTYDPAPEPAAVTFKVERVQYWLDRGVRPSDTVKSLLKREGLWGASGREDAA